MMDPTNSEHLLDAFVDGARAAKAVADGGAPDLDALDDYAQVLEALRMGVAAMGVNFGRRVEPTEDDVKNARHLVQLVREGAPSEVLIEPARQVARVDTDLSGLVRFESALVCLEGEATRVKHLEAIKEALDETIALFERGCKGGGFVSTPLDLTNVRRLREIVTIGGEDALEERRRLVAELEARLSHAGDDECWRATAVRTLYKGKAPTTSDMDFPELLVAFFGGVKAAHAILDGGAPNLDALAAAAEALEEIHLRSSRGADSFGRIKPTEDDVQNARHLAELVRRGAPSSALVEPARRAVRVATDSETLAHFQRALFCLENETCRAKHLERMKELLDLAVVLFERGVRVAGFVSTPSDLVSVRRLREIAVTDGAEALAERLRLVKELLARLPPYYTVRIKELEREDPHYFLDLTW